MDVIKELYEMKETIANEIGEANKRIRQAGGKLNAGDVDIIDKLAHSMKSLATTCAMLEAEEEGYSGQGYSGQGYSGRYAPMWNPGITYSGRRGYSRDNGNGYSGNYSRNDGRYSRDGRGYSRTGDMSEQLRQMMDEAPDDMTRNEIRKLMDRMEGQR